MDIRQRSVVAELDRGPDRDRAEARDRPRTRPCEHVVRGAGRRPRPRRRGSAADPRWPDHGHRSGRDGTRVLCPNLCGSFRAAAHRGTRTVFRASRFRRRRDLLHRPHRSFRPGLRTAAAGLACARGGALLPGHDGGSDGGPPPSPPPADRAHRHRGRRRRPRPGRAGRPGLHGSGRGRCALRLPVGAAHRPDGGDRRDDPGGAGCDHPCRPPRGPGGPGRPGNRQDRRRPAPGGVPALHPPGTAGPARSAADRSERDLPSLHRTGAALAR